MDRDVLLPVAVQPRTLRATAREVVPFGVRIGLRRLPALARWGLLSRPERGEGAYVVTSRCSPLRRPGTTYEAALQSGKEQNVARVASALDGVVLGAGRRFSWNDTVGPPLERRGFVPGPELHDGRLARGIGGGACQVANLLFWLAATAGLEIEERHRHRWDLFPDHQRTVPFGCGATVFWPHRDLVVRNPHGNDLTLHFRVDATHVFGEIRGFEPLGARFHLAETAHRFVEFEGAVWRLNTVSRIREDDRGTTSEILVHNKARVAYPVSRSQLWTPP